MFLKNKFSKAKQIKNLEKELGKNRTEELVLYNKLGSKLQLVKKIRLIEANSKEEAEAECQKIMNELSVKKNQRELEYITSMEKIEIYSKSDKFMIGIQYAQYDLKSGEELEEYKEIEKKRNVIKNEINELKNKLSELTKEK